MATASASKLQLKPLADRVVVKKLDAEDKTAGGIVLPDTAKEKPQQGEVLAVGAGRLDEKGTRQPIEVKVGDKVLFSKYKKQRSITYRKHAMFLVKGKRAFYV